MAPPKAPKNLKAAGRSLWEATVADFELAEHEMALLAQACETLDAIGRLQAALDADDVLDDAPQGRRVHPALVELRQQRLTLGRLIAQLGIPVGDEDDESHAPKKQRRATRGFYKMAAVK